MKILILMLLFIVPSDVYAFAKTPEVPSDMPKWRVGYAMSHLYPAKVTQAYGVNEQGDWTSFLHNDQQYLFRTELSRMHRYLPDYDGYGIVLGTPVGYSGQVMGTQILPDSVYIYWSSISNQRFFLTKFDLGDSLKKEMVEKRIFTTWDGVELDCYNKDIIFGFLPNGNTKLWLRGCGEYKYITELKPEAELTADTFGNDADIYKANYGKKMAARAKEVGAVLDPIPWDRVDKVYSDID
ncbi:DUF2931 family protein [Vibrio sp. TBV020]|uniref:DUF2931 family protein n=1 Tax=Vibrio sp. TBV020 TaxID=3137398 RepID=UPI0038CD3801